MTVGKQAVRVTHISSVHPWTDNRIHYRECSTLVELGYDVTLVAVESRVDGTPSSVEVVVLPRLPRLTRVVVGSFRAVKRALRTRAHVYHLHDPELVWAVPLFRFMGKKVIFDSHEDLPMQVLSKQYVKPIARPFMKLAAHAVVAIAAGSSHIIAATETIAARFPRHKVSVVHNYPPLREAEATATPLHGRPTSIAYIGGIGEVRGAVQMIDALGSPSFPSGWTLDLAGTMSESLERRLQASAGWPNVRFHGQVRPEEARDLLLQARVGLVLFQDTQAHRDSLPTKMFEYFAAGLPVIASDFPLWRSILEEYECGLLVDQKNPHSIAEAIRRYSEDEDLLIRHASNARRVAVDILNWNSEVPVLASAYQRVLA